MNARLFVTLTFLGAAFCCLSMAGAEPINTMDSEDFMYRFDFDLDPTDVSARDYDGNGQPDWTTWSGLVLDTVAGTATTPKNSYPAGYKGSNAGNLFWGTITDAYTIEIRVKAVEDGNNGTGGCVFVSNPADDERAVLLYNHLGQRWRSDSGDVVLGNADDDNHSDYVVFRIAKEAGDNTDDYWVWRDNVLLNPNGDPLHGSDVIGAYFGHNVGTTVQGEVVADYFRFTGGAYAPIPEPSTLVLLLGALGLVAVLRRGRRG